MASRRERFLDGAKTVGAFAAAATLVLVAFGLVTALVAPRSDTERYVAVGIVAACAILGVDIAKRLTRRRTGDPSAFPSRSVYYVAMAVVVGAVLISDDAGCTPSGGCGDGYSRDAYGCT